MIKLSRLRGKEFVVNADMIKYVECTPDTIITLVGNERVVVREPVDEVISRILDFRRLARLLPVE